MKTARGDEIWSIPDLKLLLSYHNKGVPPEELTEIFGRPAKYIRQKANLQGVTLGSYRYE